MQWTVLGVLIALILVVLLFMSLSIKSLKSDLWSLKFNTKSPQEVLVEEIQNLRQQNLNLLDRLMSGDLRTYAAMSTISQNQTQTIPLSQTLDSPSDMDGSYIPSMSDEAEYARERQLGLTGLQDDANLLGMDIYGR